ncbi:putative metallopeptidase [Anaerophilus nitritogenes]|uniref:putative metallopeptidase n=1 Tax=Anaerophilus nitritogenes TaxID=2498136 RepID=UPI00101CA3CC|nr:putative metallopeptidase [Anaerophilus nitritogenes]
MKKELRVMDQDTGEVLEDVVFDGGYNITFTNLSDGGSLKNIRKLDNGKFGDRQWIKNYRYRPIAERLVEKFEEISHVKPRLILFLEDTEWEPGTAKQPWIAQTKLANKQLQRMTGYQYIIETREYYTEKMQVEQLAALLYHELRHIDKDGSILKHDVEDWSNLVATLGKDWATTQATIKNILDEEFEQWNELEPVAKQLNMFNGLKVAK